MGMDPICDDDLILMYRNGDTEAFNTLFDRYYVSVYNFARMMLGSSGGAEDVLQEAFMTLAQAARTYTPVGKFRPWLMKVVRNLCLNKLRSERILRDVIAQRESNSVHVVSNNPSPCDEAEGDEQTAIIRAAIGHLPDRQREAITLYAFEEMSYREIAQVLEIPINTVKTLIYRARVSLAQSLDTDRKETKRDL